MSSRESGLTLLEMLVGMSLLFIILVLLFTAMFQISRHSNAGEKLVQQNDDYRLVTKFVRGLIEQAEPMMTLNGKQSRALFDGQGEMIEFISRLPSHAGGSGLYQVSLQVEQQTLVLKYQSLSQLADMSSHESQTQSLLWGIKSVHFEFLDPQIGWQQQWLNKQQLPAKVRFKLETENYTWPTLTVAIKTQTVPMRPHLTLAGGIL